LEIFEKYVSWIEIEKEVDKHLKLLEIKIKRKIVVNENIDYLVRN
jgi:hypothetical protein